MRREIDKKGIDLIKSFEGILDGDPTTANLDPYLCPASVWTIGYGHAIYSSGKMLKGKENKKAAYALYPGGITMKQCELLLAADVLDFCRDVQALLKVPVTQNQFNALVSFSFNVGVSALKNSTLLKKLNVCDYAGAALEFKKWDKAGGRVLAGLTRRRQAEAAMFNSNDYLRG